ncbi:MAG: hypothetical protein GXO94_00605 [Nitrospirae bacterium]|nr:hypothetical protein [Nitrospirota bacterium]
MKKQRGNSSGKKPSVRGTKDSRSAKPAPKPAPAKPAAGPEPAKPVKGWKVTGIKKQYLKTRPVCRVTFRLPKEAAPDARKVSIVGDFNNWDKGSAVMKRLKNGDFTITMELETGREYCYRYLIDATRWENDWWADRYRPNPFGCDDSVVVL